VIAQAIALRPLRASAPEDESLIYALHAAVRAEELGMQGWEPALRDRILRQQFDAQRHSYRDQYPGAVEHLILRGDAPVGWLVIDRGGPALLGLDIGLVPDARRQGIGTLIIRDLQQQAALEARPMRLDVLRLNVRARSLYERLGFRATGQSSTHTTMEWRAAALPSEAIAFERQLDTTMRIDLGRGGLALRIAEVANRSRDGVQRFSVYLHGPVEPALPQGSYLVHHDALGSFVLFIVPVIGSDAERIVYEACFTRPAAPAPAP
jgi:GNAT superfamily N-acetyltransferase